MSQYLRLLSLAVTANIASIATLTWCAVSLFVYNARVKPYTSWDAVHTEYGLIAQYLEDLVGANMQTYVVNFYQVPMFSFIFFAFFAFGDDAVRSYVSWYNWLKAKVWKRGHNE